MFNRLGSGPAFALVEVSGPPRRSRGGLRRLHLKRGSWSTESCVEAATGSGVFRSQHRTGRRGGAPRVGPTDYSAVRAGAQNCRKPVSAEGAMRVRTVRFPFPPPPPRGSSETIICVSIISSGASFARASRRAVVAPVFLVRLQPRLARPSASRSLPALTSPAVMLDAVRSNRRPRR